ncbi:MAG: hypothetical protein GX147_11040 [Deltaproteobacteria bacterium]|nr:hypothetical protein [Deltaproteobacteria bacterium]
METVFASAERQRRRELIGKALAIGGMSAPSHRGVMATASYEARLFGIHSAVPTSLSAKLS